MRHRTNKGSTLLCAAAGTAAIAVALQTTVSTVQRWRNGSVAPSPAAKAGLLSAYGIPIEAWDQAPDGSEPRPELPEPEPDADTSREAAAAHLRAVRAWMVGAETMAERAKGHDAVRKAIELQARLDGAFNSATDENRLAESPRYQAVLAAIFDALRPHQDALAAVTVALEALEAGA